MVLLLDVLESEALAIGVGKFPNYELMSDIFRYMIHYPDSFHHPKEDLVFVRLLKRDPASHAVVGNLLKQHEAIAKAGREFVQVMHDTSCDSVSRRETVQKAGLSYANGLREHMRTEEAEVFPMVKLLLLPEDWTAIDEEIAIIEDPLFGKSIADEYRRLAAMITGSVQG